MPEAAELSLEWSCYQGGVFRAEECLEQFVVTSQKANARRDSLSTLFHFALFAPPS